MDREDAIFRQRQCIVRMGLHSVTIAIRLTILDSDHRRTQWKSCGEDQLIFNSLDDQVSPIAFL